MWQAVVNFFAQPPPALDPVFIPWLTALIAGNIIIATGVWTILKQIAKLTPWAKDDKIIQILTGIFTAVKDSVSPLPKDDSDDDEIIFELVEEEEEEAEEECDHKLSAPDAEVCEKCGQPVD